MKVSNGMIFLHMMDAYFLTIGETFDKLALAGVPTTIPLLMFSFLISYVLTCMSHRNTAFPLPDLYLSITLDG